MSNSWPLVLLADVLKPVSRPEPVDPEKTYRILGAHWYAHGLYIKDSLTGAEIRADKVFRVEEGDFVYNRLFAWKGSFALATQDNEGCYVSNEFPCFALNRDRIDGNYLWRYFSRASVWDEALEFSTGGTPTSRNRLKEEKFLAMKIPLPPLPVQQRIAARIEELAAKIEEACSHRKLINDEVNKMLLAQFSRLIAGAESKPMNEVAPIIRRPVAVRDDGNYPELGIRSFGKGTFHKPALNAIEVGTKRLFYIEPGDLLFNNVFAWEGAVAVVGAEDSGRFGSHRFITCLPKNGTATAEFLCFYFLTEEGLNKLGEASPGGAGRNRTLGLEALSKIDVPVPFYEQQLWFDNLQAKVETLKQSQAETSAELDAVVPSILDRAFTGDL